MCKCVLIVLDILTLLHKYSSKACYNGCVRYQMHSYFSICIFHISDLHFATLPIVICICICIVAYYFLQFCILPTHARQGLKFLIKKTYSSRQFACKWRSSLFLKMLSVEAVTISFSKWFQLTLVSNVVKPNTFNLCSYVVFRKPLTIFVALVWVIYSKSKQP